MGSAPLAIIVVFLGLFFLTVGPGRDRQPAAAEGRPTEDLLSVRDLLVHYGTPLAAVKAADGISFGLRGGERLGIAGESGSGKSTLALAILRMIKPRAASTAARSGWMA